MQSGIPFNDLDGKLVDARSTARQLTDSYNRSIGFPQPERESLLRLLFKTVGEEVHFEPDVRCEFGFNISIGNRFYGNFDCILLDGNEILIGDDVMFGPRVSIYTTNHSLDAIERINGISRALPVKIGNGVWLGGGVHVTPGVTIGDGAVIGAGSVVTQNIPPNVLAVGVPCRVLRAITTSDRMTAGSLIRE